MRNLWLDRAAIKKVLDKQVWQTTDDIAAKSGVPVDVTEEILDEMLRLKEVDVTWNQHYKPVWILL